MSTSVAVGGGRESKKDEGEEQKGVIAIEEDEFTPPDGGIRVCTNVLRIGVVILIFFFSTVNVSSENPANNILFLKMKMYFKFSISYLM